MRLLHTVTYLLEEFFEDRIPVYAILSHRWEVEEVTFQDFDPVKGFTSARQKKGWSKMMGCCKQGFEDGYEWVWIDTCCIDKSSSVEFSEAINFMFKWYKMADICYAYLSDVGGIDKKDQSTGEVKFVDSKWFERGWTLQELLAPEVLVFFDRSWRRFGEKLELEEYVERATSIQSLKHYDTASIAQKMSWAAKRRTTRIEDRAYSLMGIFGIHMSPIYGEGKRAFLRLQLEIIKVSDDESVFAWQQAGLHSGMLANSPDAFEHFGCVMRGHSRSPIQSFEMTNKGLRFKSSLFTVSSIIEPEDDVVLLLLNCTAVQTSGEDMTLLVGLEKVGYNEFVRAGLSSYHAQQLKLFRSLDGDKSGISEFYVIQYSEEYPAASGPYTFTTRTALEVRSRYKFSSLDDAYVSDPIKGQWSVSEDGEMVLQTTELPATGINAALMLRETDCQENTSSEPPMKLLFVFHIYKNQFEYESTLLRAESKADERTTVLRLLKRNPAGQRQQAGLDIDPMFGPSAVRVEYKSWKSYDIMIEIGQVFPVEYRSEELSAMRIIT